MAKCLFANQLGLPCPKLLLIISRHVVEVPIEWLGLFPLFICFVNTSMSNYVILCISASGFCLEFRPNEGNNLSVVVKLLW